MVNNHGGRFSNLLLKNVLLLGRRWRWVVGWYQGCDCGFLSQKCLNKNDEGVGGLMCAWWRFGNEGIEEVECPQILEDLRRSKWRTGTLSVVWAPKKLTKPIEKHTFIYIEVILDHHHEVTALDIDFQNQSSSKSCRILWRTSLFQQPVREANHFCHNNSHVAQGD